MFLFITDCIKYNYNNSKTKNVDITIDNNSFIYSNGFKRTNIPIHNIIAIMYGPQTTTFKNVTKCKPWLVCSFILENRTYDFEFKRFMDIMAIQYMFKKNNPECYIENKKIISYHFGKMVNRDKGNDTYLKWFNSIRYKNTPNIPYNTECPICLDTIDIDKQYILNCRHNYHEECIGLVNNHLCPICRSSF